MDCHDCDMLSINGVPCHERGGPNSNARWDDDSCEWVRQRKCFTCGYTVDHDDECCDGESDFFDELNEFEDAEEDE